MVTTHAFTHPKHMHCKWQANIKHEDGDYDMGAYVAVTPGLSPMLVKSSAPPHTQRATRRHTQSHIHLNTKPTHSICGVIKTLTHTSDPTPPQSTPTHRHGIKPGKQYIWNTAMSKPCPTTTPSQQPEWQDKMGKTTSRHQTHTHIYTPTYIHTYITLHYTTLHYSTLHTYISMYTYIHTCNKMKP